MKKLVLSTLLFFLALSSSFSQVGNLYVDGMKWVTTNYTFDGNFNVTEKNETYTYIIQGDSVIDGIKYKKLNQYYYSKKENLEYYFGTFLARYNNGKYLFYIPEIKDYLGEEYYIGNDYVLFDDKLKVGDSLPGNAYEKIAFIGDTIFQESSTIKRKYWKMQPYSNSSGLYTEILNRVVWVEGIGQLIEPIPQSIFEVDCPCYNMLTCCINPAGDTIYKSDKYFGLNITLSLSSPIADNLTISPVAGGLSVNLGTATDWLATLYNSNGVTVAQQQGNGSEIFLPTDSKGTHILVVKAGGKVVKKKVLLR
ncbi:MAG: hypothetical protein IJW68_08085 [Bacteroidaceae bacterium]|nr:hypothetical protein [Bacteroidaceae bacterium]